MISGENVSVRADDHARAEALKRLLALPLRKLSAEKLSQRVVGKRKRRYAPRHRLGSEYRHHAGRDLLDDRRKTRDNTRLRGRGFLRRGRRGARRETQDGADQQLEGPKNSSLHDVFPLQENRTLDRRRPFLQIRLAMNVERSPRRLLNNLLKNAASPLIYLRLRRFPLPPSSATSDKSGEVDLPFYCSVALTCSGRRVACRSRLSQQARLPAQPPLSSPLRELARVFRDLPHKDFNFALGRRARVRSRARPRRHSGRGSRWWRHRWRG